MQSARILRHSRSRKAEKQARKSRSCSDEIAQLIRRLDLVAEVA